MNNNLAEKIVMNLLAFANEQLQELMREEELQDNRNAEAEKRLLKKLDALREKV